MDTGEASQSSWTGSLTGLQNPVSVADFLEIAFEAVVVVDAQERITFWNPAAEQMYGWTSQEVLGKNPADLFWPLSSPQERKNRKQRQSKLKRGETLKGEQDVCRKDGSFLRVQYAARANFDARGQFTGYLAVYRDISSQMLADKKFRQKEEGSASPDGADALGESEYKRVVGQLERSNQKLTEILASIQDDFYVLNRDWKFVYASRSFTSKIGKEPEDFIGNNIWEMFPKHVGSTLEENFRAAMEKREIRRFELGGQYTNAWYRMTAFPSAEGITVLGTDVTERRRTQQALLESEKRYRQLVKFAPAGIYEIDIKTSRFIEVNDILCELLGYSREELLSMMPDQLLEDESRNHFRERVSKTLAGEPIPEETEYRVRRKDGREIWAVLNTTIRYDNGMPKSASVVAHDITERKRMEQQLRESQQRLSLTYAHTAIGIVETSPDGTFTGCNEQFCKSLGYTKDEVLGRTIENVTYKDDVPMEVGKLRQLIAGQIPFYRIEKRYVRKDGSLFWAEVVRTMVRDEHGKALFGIGAVLDITERKKMEEALVAARQRAEKAASRMARLQEVTAELSQNRTSLEIGKTIVEKGAPAFGASSCSILLLSEDGQSLQFLYSNTAENIRRKWNVFPISLNTPATDAVRSGEPIWIESQQQYLERYPHLTDNIKEWGYEASLSVPLVYKERILGVLALSFSQPLAYSPEDQDYVLTLARQGAQALERVRADEARRLDATMMRNVAAGIYLVRASDGLIIHTNPNFDKLFGYEPGEVLGEPVSILNAPTDQSPAEVAEQTMAFLRDNGSWQGEVYSTRKDGTRFWCSASISRFEHASHGTVWVAARQDITERKRAEEALRENEKQLKLLNETLEQKVQEKTAEVRRLASELTKAEQRERNRISQILHEDLQQRLFAIQMQMAVLRERLQIGDGLAGTELAYIKEQLDEILIITRHLSIDLSPPILHDEGLLQAISWLASQMQDQHGLHIEVHGEGSFAFPDKDLQVLLFNCVRELLLNIVQHAEVRRAFVTLQRSGTDLQIEVRDDGKGFLVDTGEELMSRALDKGGQHRPSFGLATIRQQLSLFGGSMVVRSEPGKGTQVNLVVRLPEQQ